MQRKGKNGMRDTHNHSRLGDPWVTSHDCKLTYVMLGINKKKVSPLRIWTIHSRHWDNKSIQDMWPDNVLTKYVTTDMWQGTCGKGHVARDM